MHFPLCGKSRLLPVFELAAADVHRTSAFQWVRVLHLIIIYRPPRMGQPIFWCERGDSIAVGCKRRPAGVWQCPAGALHLSGFESPLALKNPNAPKGIRIFWCERGDSNPHGITTRTSNVLVYHSNTLASAWILYPIFSVLSILFYGMGR